MRRLFLFTLIIFFSLFVRDVLGSSEEVVLNAKVLEVGSVVEQEGLRMQTVKCEILEGEYKGSITEVQVPLENDFLRPVKKADRIKISWVSIGEDDYFQFYDFARSRSYIWLFGLFLIFLIVLLGWKGLKTLLPSFLLILLLLIGVFPDWLPRIGLLLGSIIVVGFLATVTTWIRIKHKLLTIIVPFSVILSLLAGLIVFVGFSQTAYVVPFIGSLAIVDEKLYLEVIDLLLVSIFFVPAGGVINASIQIAKYLVEEFGSKKVLSVGEMLKEGFRISQKISAGELNNMIMLIIGMSLAGIYLIKRQYENISFWDNGWISLQVIYVVAAGLSILLITPITVFVTAAVIGLSLGKAVLRGQRRFKVSR